MDTDTLHAFVTIARCGSFSDAAQQLFLTQPAVSKRIAKLEENLNHRLFDRMGKDLQLTEAGRALLPKAEQILRDIEEVARGVRDLSGEIVGTLRVATSHHIGLHHLPPILRVFASDHSDVTLQFEFVDSEKAYERVSSGECELAVATLNPTRDDSVSTTVLWHDEMYAVVASNHELAKQANVCLSDLCLWPAILPGSNTYTGRIIQDTFESADLRLQINMSTNYLETIKTMVSVGLGWSILPKTLIDDSMHVIAVNDLKVSRELGLIKHRRRSLSNAGLAFVKTATGFGGHA